MAAAPAPTWSDEFDVPGLPDPARWDYEVGCIRNHEAQCYTRAREANVHVADGSLVITARKEDYGEGDSKAAYTSASLTTRGRQAFSYGRFEVRAKVPDGRGVWPSIWFLGEDFPSLGWPRCGEIALMEYVGCDPHHLHVNLHTERFNHRLQTTLGVAVPVTDAAEAWHTCVLEWHRHRLEVSIDGVPVYAYADDGGGRASWPYDRPFHLKLNLAIGGWWGGREGIDDAIFPRRLLIDHVRYWESGE